MQSLKAAGIGVTGQALGSFKFRLVVRYVLVNIYPKTQSHPKTLQNPEMMGIVCDLAVVNVPLCHKFAPPPLPAESADEAAGLLGECPPANCREYGGR